MSARIIAHPALTELAVNELASRLGLTPCRYRIGDGPERVLLHRQPDPKRLAARLVYWWCNGPGAA